MDEVATKVAAGMFAMVLIMAAMMPFLAPASEPASADTIHASAAEARRHVGDRVTRLLNAYGAALPAGAQLAEADCRCDSAGTNDWAMVRVSPADVARLRRQIVLGATRAGRTEVRTATLVRTDADHLPPATAAARPAWWRPTVLPDAELASFGHSGGILFIFSERTATLYAALWAQ